MWQPTEHTRICGFHFISTPGTPPGSGGIPSNKEGDPNYIPSRFETRQVHEKTETDQKRYQRKEERGQKQKYTTGMESKVSCPLCDVVLGNKYRLKAHIESIHEGKKHVCDMCGHSVAYQVTLREHIKIVHKGKKIVKKNRPPKICSVCQKSLRDSYKLKMHIRSVHENQSV